MVDTTKENEQENPDFQQSQSNQKEPVITPKENDELQIETEDTNQNSEPNVPDYEAQAEAELEKLQQQRNHKHGHKHGKPEQNKAPRTSSGQSKINKGLIVAIIILSIIGISGFILVMYPEALAKKYPILVEKGIIKLQDTVKTNVPVKDTISQQPTEETVAEPIQEEPVAVPQEKVNVEPPKPVQKVEEPKEDVRGEGIIAPKKIQQEERIVKKGRITTPCWLISVSSVSNEAAAIKIVAKLTNVGKNCGYYWIPDYVSTGPKLFKIYIGPYTSKENALKDLPGIKEASEGAYVTELK